MVLENVVTIVLPENQESGKAIPFNVFGELQISSLVCRSWVEGHKSLFLKDLWLFFAFRRGCLLGTLLFPALRQRHAPFHLFFCMRFFS